MAVSSLGKAQEFVRSQWTAREAEFPLLGPFLLTQTLRDARNGLAVIRSKDCSMSVGQFISDPYVLWAALCFCVLLYDLLHSLNSDWRAEADEHVPDDTAR